MKKIVKFLPLLLLVAALTAVFALHASATEVGREEFIGVSSTARFETEVAEHGEDHVGKTLGDCIVDISAFVSTHEVTDAGNVIVDGVEKQVVIRVIGQLTRSSTSTSTSFIGYTPTSSSQPDVGTNGKRVTIYIEPYTDGDRATLKNKHGGASLCSVDYNLALVKNIDVVTDNTGSGTQVQKQFQMGRSEYFYIGPDCTFKAHRGGAAADVYETDFVIWGGTNVDNNSHPVEIEVNSGEFKRISFMTGYSRSLTTYAKCTIGGTAVVDILGGMTGTPSAPKAMNGNADVYIKGGKVKNYYGFIGDDSGLASATANGNITTTVSGNAEIVNFYYGGIYNGTLTGNVTNIFEGGPKIGTEAGKQGAYGGTSKGTITGTVTNIVKGGTFYFLCGSTYEVGTVCNVVNKISGGTFVSNFTGGSYKANLAGDVTNTITGGSFKLYIGGTREGTQKGTVTNNISGGDFTYNGDSGSYFSGGAYSGGTVDGDVVNNVSGGTFRTAYMGGYTASSTITGSVTNTITGGTFENYYGSNGVVNGSVENTFTGSSESPISVKSFFGGGATNSQVKNGIVNTVENGEYIEIKESFYSGGYRGTVEAGEATYAVDTYIENLVTPRFFGGMGNADATYTSEISGDVYSELVNCTVTATITNTNYYSGVYGGGQTNGIDGDCTLVIRGGEVKAVSAGALRETGKVTGTMYVTLDLTDDDITMFSLMEPGTEVTLIAGSGTLYLTSAPETINVVDIQGGTPDVEIDCAHDGVVYLTLASGYVEGDVNFTNTGAGDVEFRNQSFVGFVAEPVANTIIMEDDFSLRYLFNKSTMDAKSVTAVQVSFDNATWTDAPLTSYNDQYYGILVKDIAAKNIGDTIYLKVPGNDVVDEYSIVEACKVVIANMGKVFSNEFVNLAKTLMNYGAAAKTNFGYTGGADITTDSTAPAAAEYNDASSVGDSTGKAVKIVGTSLLAKDAISIKFYIEIGEENAADLTVKVNGVDCAMTQNGKYYTVSYEVPAREMRSDATVEVWKSGAVVSNTYVDSISSYCAYVRDNSTDTNLKALCEAIMAYVDAAIAYLG